MESAQGCFSSCFSTVESTSSKPHSVSTSRPAKIRLNPNHENASTKVHSLSRKKDEHSLNSKRSPKRDKLELVFHSKIGNNNTAKPQFRHLKKNTLDFSQNYHNNSAHQYSSSAVNSLYRSNIELNSIK